MYQSCMLKEKQENYQGRFQNKSMFVRTLSTMNCKHLSSTGQQKNIITQHGNFHKPYRQVAFTTGQNNSWLMESLQFYWQMEQRSFENFPT